MATTDFVFNRLPGKLEEFLKKLQTIGAPTKITSDFPASVGFGSSHARGFAAVLKYAGLIDSSGQPTEAYKKGLRGGPPGRVIVGKAIAQGYKPMFDVYPDAPVRAESDLITFIKSHSDFDDERAGLAVKTFKVLCKFGDFDSGSADGDGGEVDEPDEQHDTNSGRRRPPRNGGARASGSVVINVNIALSVDATSDPAVYDAFFAAMAKHLKGLDGGS